MKTGRLVLAVILLGVPLAGWAWAQFRVPIRIPVRVPVTPRVPHVVPHLPHGSHHGSSDDDSAFWWIVGGVAGTGGIGYLAYRWWKRPKPVRTFLIRIAAMPPGEAPEWVRRAWVGLVLPVTQPGEDPQRVKAIGVVSNEAQDSKVAYVVAGRTAIGLLDAHDEAASQWWRENVPEITSEHYHLGFPEEVCDVVKRAG